MNQQLQADDSATNQEIKACCAAVYENDWVRLLLGDSFHPGGLALTEQLGAFTGLDRNQHVLDVASGTGASAIFLNERFGCEVVGIDYSLASVTVANVAATETGQATQVCFKLGDAERLPFEDNSFDAIICECAFCTFPDKPTAAAEFFRVLRPGGRLGLSDVTRMGSLPEELKTLFAWITCIADAQSVDMYKGFLKSAGLIIDQIEVRDEFLNQMAIDLQVKLLGAEMLTKLKRIDLPGADFRQARRIARSASKAIREGKLGYVFIVASSPVISR